MGVAGSGKTTIGQALAKALSWPFFEGDDYHPQANANKIASGTPLNDDDRWPWLTKLSKLITSNLTNGQSFVLSCSALKESYRKLLTGGRPVVRYVYLKGDFELIYSRMESRPIYYMRPEMLPSQFEALEEPKNALVIDISKSIEEIVEIIRLDLAQTRS
jgi:carbohydrate kinase (thermoresistant glucokinase family)